MSYYRASLAEAKNGNLIKAYNLVLCSLLLNENTEEATQLSSILYVKIKHDRDTFLALKKAVDNKNYRDALKIKLPDTPKSQIIRGMLYRKTHRYIRSFRMFYLWYKGLCV